MLLVGLERGEGGGSDWLRGIEERKVAAAGYMRTKSLGME